MGLFGKRKDWNVIAIIFEKKDLYRVNGNRGKGSEAAKIRDGAKGHARTIFWAVFDQQGAFLEGDAGPGCHLVPRETLAQLTRELPKIATVRSILSQLESGPLDKAAKPLDWTGYPADGKN